MSLLHDSLFLKKVPLVKAISGRQELDEEAAGVAGNEQVELAQLHFPFIAPLSPGRWQQGRREERERRWKGLKIQEDALSRELLPEWDWTELPLISHIFKGGPDCSRSRNEPGFFCHVSDSFALVCHPVLTRVLLRSDAEAGFHPPGHLEQGCKWDCAAAGVCEWKQRLFWDQLQHQVYFYVGLLNRMLFSRLLLNTLFLGVLLWSTDDLTLSCKLSGCVWRWDEGCAVIQAEWCTPTECMQRRNRGKVTFFIQRTLKIPLVGFSLPVTFALAAVAA